MIKSFPTKLFNIGKIEAARFDPIRRKTDTHDRNASSIRARESLLGSKTANCLKSLDPVPIMRD